MKLSILGLAVAGAMAVLLQTGISAQSSTAVAAETCIKTNVTLHVKRCGADAAQASASSGGSAAEPTGTPTSGPAPSCIKTNVAKHVKACK